MKFFLVVLVCLGLAVNVSADDIEYRMMSYEELSKIDASTLDKKAQKEYKKAFKDAKKNHELYGHYLTDGEVKISKIGTVDGVSPDVLYEVARDYLINPTNTYIRSSKYQKGFLSSLTGSGTDYGKKEFLRYEDDYKNNARILSERPGEAITSNLVIMYQSKKVMDAVRTLFFQTELKTEFREGRYRIRTGRISWEHWNNHTGEQQPIYATKSAKAMGCDDKGTMEMLLRCNKGRKSIKKAVDFYMETLNETINNIESVLNSIEEDDDW